ncbi:MAG: hypothetical protein Q9164_003427 [Protoblastenia rupestris]
MLNYARLKGLAYQDSERGRYQAITWLRYQRIRWLAAFTLLGILAWLLTRHPRPEEHISPAYAGPHLALSEEAHHGFLELHVARDFCQRRRWDVYSTRDQPRKVFDLFLINTELDWLEIRLHELSQEVDFFVVLESANTFQQNPKPLYLQDNLSLFPQFQHKIIHRVLNDSGVKIPEDDTWEHERFTRNALFDQVMLSLTGPQAPNQGDVLLVGDVDEIPRVETLTALRNCAFPPRVTLRSQMYYYSFQWLHRGQQWHHPQATYYNGQHTVRPENLRQGKPDVELHSSSWHCSSCFPSMADLKNKITSFSHKGYNQPYFLDSDRLLQRVRRGDDLFERKEELYDRIDDNPDVPTYLRKKESQQKFAYMLDRDPENGNFQDL